MAYGAKGERNGKHRDGKKQHAQWFTDEEWSSLNSKAESLETDVTGMMRGIANNEILVSRRRTRRTPKA